MKSSVQTMVRILLVVIVVVAALASSAKLPSNFKTCKSNDSSFQACLKGAIQEIIPSLVNGIPSLGVLPLDPLEISHLEIGEGDGPVKVNLEFNNIKLSGLQMSQLKSVTMDTKNYKLDTELYMPQPITLYGHYKVKGQVLVLPITGEGNCNFTLTDLKSQSFLQGEPVTKNGETYMNVKDNVMIIDTSHLYIHLENLFNGNKALGDNMNTFLNENWKDIFAELKPGFEAALSASFKEIANRVFSKVPFKQVFPEN